MGLTEGPRSPVGLFPFPVRCPGCGSWGDGLCAPCLASAEPAPPVPPPAGIDAWYAPFAYAGAVREAVARIKYRNERVAIGPLAAAMAACLPGVPRVEAVTWVPTTVDRRRDRGFDHARLLATALAGRLRLPCRRLLRRLGHVPQTGLSGPERRGGPRFEVVASVRSVLLVDDVATTGATLRNAASALRAARCEWVIAVTCARTPLKLRPPPPDRAGRRPSPTVDEGTPES